MLHYWTYTFSHELINNPLTWCFGPVHWPKIQFWLQHTFVYTAVNLSAAMWAFCGILSLSDNNEEEMGRKWSVGKKCKFQKFKTVESKAEIIRPAKISKSPESDTQLDLNQLSVSLWRKRTKLKHRSKDAVSFELSNREVRHVFVFLLQDGTTPEQMWNM